MAHREREFAFWSVPVSEILQKLQTGPEGLKGSESGERLKTYGANILKPKKRSNTLKILFSQFKSPIILILLFAAGMSFFLHDPTDTVIIAVIILLSSILGFWQEKGAAVIFAINVYLQRPVLDSLLFSFALAVGLTPQLLPAIISVNLSHGARDGTEESDRQTVDFH